MVKLTLNGCKHPILRTWDSDGEVHHVTCLVCYERLLLIDDGRWTAGQRDRSNAPRDSPALYCTHAHREPIDKSSRFQKANFTDVMCADCGVVLRHPDGPGGWHEVLFNGYVIKEEP